MKSHWSDRYECVCGMKFRSYATEAKHRHNFPALCRKGKKLDAHFAQFEKRDAAHSAPQTGVNDDQH